ncbi:type II toxin-antitoxin system RelE/ParE family toxin [Gemmatimonas sp.]|uniref:type II toxin-antitoxin system RelE/ParE family toxin n=1 Tax=Gemmatimonas sp. TaxID=1962908 RepID=UPI00356587F0
MDVYFDSAATGKLYSSKSKLQRKLGDKQAAKVMTRLKQLEQAESLEELRNAPGRCHELTADRAGQLSLDLVHPMRLIFRPEEQPPPRNEGDTLDWARIDAVVILEIDDPH